MSDDHLNEETSISAELTETGVKAAAKSRAVASIDRLVGNVADLGNAWVEGVTARKRAKNDGERQLIEAAARYGLERMQSDDVFASRAFENHYKKIAQRQLNRDSVAAEALEDLRQTPPTEEEAMSGPDTVSEEFFDCFERYAEGATTDELRQRWGRILAGEIRKPGTFSSRVLRATDELDADVAALFESLMPYRVNDVLVECVMPELTLQQNLNLVSAGLIFDSGFTGHRNQFGQGKFRGEEVWATQFGSLIVSFPKSAQIPGRVQKVVEEIEGKPAYGIFILTDVGKALASILPSREELLGLDYAKRLRTAISPIEIFVWREIEPQKFVQVDLPLS
jgi:hypothetical protein